MVTKEPKKKQEDHEVEFIESKSVGGLSDVKLFSGGEDDAKDNFGSPRGSRDSKKSEEKPKEVKKESSSYVFTTTSYLTSSKKKKKPTYKPVLPYVDPKDVEELEEPKYVDLKDDVYKKSGTSYNTTKLTKEEDFGDGGYNSGSGGDGGYKSGGDEGYNSEGGYASEIDSKNKGGDHDSFAEQEQVQDETNKN